MGGKIPPPFNLLIGIEKGFHVGSNVYKNREREVCN